MQRSDVAFVGIDAGTTALKAALFDADGQTLALSHQEYDLLTPAPGYVEAPAEVYWEACCRAIRSIVAQIGGASDRIAALCISSQGETLIPVDSAGVPLRNAIVWLDNRATAEAREIEATFDPALIYQRTGQPTVSPAWPACKLLWLRRHEPDLFRQAARVLLVGDFLLHRLTGEFVTDLSLQSSSLLLDIKQKSWWMSMLEYVGVPPDRFGRLQEPGAVVGSIRPEAAAATGLCSQTVAVSGALDQTMSALGAGNIAPGMASETTGSAMAIQVTTATPVFDPKRRVPIHYHAIADRFCLLPWGQTAGMALRWFRDEFCREEMNKAHAAGKDAYDLMTDLAAQTLPGSDGLIMLPHLEGAACPEFNPAAKGVFFGVTLRHTKGHFLRSILEATAYMLRRNLSLVEQMGEAVSELRSTGGAARSPRWLQIKADVTQRPIRPVETAEAGCLGAGILGARATGHISTIEQGVAQMVRVGPEIVPDPVTAAVYYEAYGRYIELYDRLAPMFYTRDSGERKSW